MAGECGCVSTPTRTAPDPRVATGAWWRIGAGILLAANGMALGLAVNVSETTAGERAALHVALAGATLVSLLLLGPALFRRAAAAIRERRVTVEALFLTGILGASGASLLSIARGEGPVYFETVLVLLVAYSLGREIGGFARDRALTSLASYDPARESCEVRRAGGVREIPVAQVARGDVVIVHPGRRVPVDGVVRAGAAFVVESTMTGEFGPRRRAAGSRVFAGTHCVDGTLEIAATAAGTERRIDAIAGAIRRARRRPGRLQGAADRIAAVFVPVVIAASAATFLGWTGAVGWERALLHAMSVLLVACPCALGFATPVVVWAALGRLARLGLRARGGESVERLAGADVAVFDKTGTLTHASDATRELVLRPPAGLDESILRGEIEAVERATDHPLARALRDLGGEAPDRFRVRAAMLPGAGVEACVSSGARRPSRLRLGDPGVLVPESDRRAWERLRGELRGPAGGREIAILRDGAVVGAAAVAERGRGEWEATARRLREAGLRTVVMTGDRAEGAARFPADACLARLTPERKREEVERLERAGHRVLFVGDGLNDAAAMAEGTVGIAVAGGSPVARDVADLHWDGRSLADLARAVRVARAAVRRIRLALGYALAYNSIGMGIAAAGRLHPVTAVLLMTASSLFVTLYASRFGVEEESAAPAPPVAPTRRCTSPSVS